MARLRNRYADFVSRGAEIVAVGPGSPEIFKRYWKYERIPFIGLPDPDHQVALLYRQEVNLFKLGRMPLICIVDKNGFVRYVHYGASMRDISSTADLLHVIDELNESSN